MIIKLIMIIAGVLTTVTAFALNLPAFGEDSPIYVRGPADNFGPYSGSYLRVLVSGHEGTIIVTSNKLGFVKLDLSDPVRCYDVRERFCYTGLVTDTRKVAYPSIGDLVRLSLDPDGNKHSISFLKGQKVGSTQYITPNPKSLDTEKLISVQKFLALPLEANSTGKLGSQIGSKMRDALTEAKGFTMTHPTFSYDGIPQSLSAKVVSVISGKVPVYVVEIQFNSTHVGYGDRTNQTFAERTTPHKMVVMISDSSVGSAIIDGVWDEFNQNWQK